MKKKSDISLLFIVPFVIPIQHTVMVNAYQHFFTENNNSITWIARKDTKTINIEKRKWGRNTLYLIPNFGANTLIARFFGALMLLKLISLIPNIIKKEKIDIIQVRNDELSSLIALYFSKKHRIPFVYQNSFPKNRSRIFESKNNLSSYSYLNNLLVLNANLLHKIRLYIMIKSNLILSISTWMKKQLMFENIPSNKIYPFPLGYRKVEIPISKSFLNNKSGNKTLIYIGTLDNTRELGLIIDVFRDLFKDNKNLNLLMVGDGNDRKRLEESCKNYKIEHKVFFTGKVKHEKVKEYISHADIGLCPIPPYSFFKVSSPTKLVEYMGQGIPVIANKEIPDSNYLLKKSGGGVRVNFNSEDFKKSIQWLLDNPNHSFSLGKRGKAWVEKNRNFEFLTRDLILEYNNLLKR